MDTKPQVWHYGLVAQWWAEFNESGPEITYFQKLIERYGQPALDVGCGTGRLLLPYLRAGLDVDGCDISSDMLARCREKAEREGLSPRLHAQAMHELALPRTYKTIIVCGAFGLGGNRRQDVEALRRFHQHLEPGGVLVFDHHVPYTNAQVWQYWCTEKRRQLPESWSPSGKRKQAADGTEYEMRMRIMDIDPLEQLMTLQIRVAQWRAGQLVAEEENSLQARSYFKNEVLMLLAQAGFRDVDVHGDYTDTAATADHGVLVYIAKK